jgi:UDP-GlcNAc:undecaprenyl-phosphate GlcNAc-1-phosphate transferase
MHKRRVLEVIVDVALICLAYTLSFLVRFEGNIPGQHFRVLAQSFPLILPLKLFIFASFGLYRGVWRYVGMRDLLSIFKAVTLSSLLVISAITMLFRFDLFPRSVFIIDWMALLLLVAGSRVLIRVIREYLFSLSDMKGKRVVIVGAGDAGEMVLRELRNNVGLGYVPVGFFDDDPDKLGRRIHGVPVLGGREAIPDTVAKLGIEHLIVAMPSASEEALGGIMRICEATGVPITVMPSIADLIRKNLTEDLLPPRPWTSPPGAVQTIPKEPTWN